MPVCNPSDLPRLIARRTRLMAFDVGTRTIGLAVSDPALGFAAPAGTIRRTRWREEAARIAELVAYWGVGGYVVGLALNMDDSEGPSAQRCRAFARNLLAAADLPLAFWDERLSTHAAEEAMRAAGERRDRLSRDIDSAAATVILQDMLDALRRGAPPGGGGVAPAD
jgi:putative Holliday junction resolvase